MDRSVDLVKKAIEFRGPERVPVSFTQFKTPGFTTDFPKVYGEDFHFVMGSAFNFNFISETQYIDEWGCIWETFGDTMGEVKTHPLKEWEDLEKLKIPDLENPARYENQKPMIEQNQDKFKMGAIAFVLFERMHHLRGFQQLMEDFYLERENVEKLGDIIVEHTIRVINTYAELGCDAIFSTDDWGVQDRLLISPKLWREIFKPRYKKIFDAAHKRNMKYILHSCGQITDILDDFIEIGLDVIQMDQQDNMGIDLLSERFGGRICFFCPTDIQTTLINNDKELIEAKAKELIEKLGKFKGGFMAKTYPQPTDIGATEESVKTMCEAFIKYGRYF